MRKYSYIFKGETHTDTTAQYMAGIGMSEEQVESVLNDESFERSAQSKIETGWRNSKLSRVLDLVDQYERDQVIAQELRTSKINSGEYAELLSDRKVLCDYPEVDGYPFVERPHLSYLALN